MDEMRRAKMLAMWIVFCYLLSMTMLGAFLERVVWKARKYVIYVRENGIGGSIVMEGRGSVPFSASKQLNRQAVDIKIKFLLFLL